MNAERLLKETVPIPPISLQAHITKLLDKEYAVTQSLAQTVRFINEYRTRLIADVVTGKLDVRTAAAHLPDVGAIHESPLHGADTLDGADDLDENDAEEI